MVDGAGAELPVELLGSESSEVVDGEGPEVEHVVPGKGVSLLDHHHLTAQQGQLDGRPQTTRAAADDQTLDGVREGLINGNSAGFSLFQLLCFGFTDHNHKQQT